MRNDSISTRDWLVGLTVDAVATYSTTSSDVGEAFETDAIEPGVEEAKLFLASAEAGIVQESDDGGKDRGCCGGAAGMPHSVIDDDRITRSISKVRGLGKLVGVCEDGGGAANGSRWVERVCADIGKGATVDLEEGFEVF